MGVQILKEPAIAGMKIVAQKRALIAARCRERD